MRRICESRGFVSFLIASAVWMFGNWMHPFPAQDPILSLVQSREPHIYQALYWSCRAMWFTTPFWISLIALSALSVCLLRRRKRAKRGRLSPYPKPPARQNLFLIIGEVHRRLRPQPSPAPEWLRLPRRGLFTGLCIFGATGTGKTSACMRPFAEQLLAFRAYDPSGA